MDLSKNCLTVRLVNFLKSENSVRNRAQARIDINKHIDRSIIRLNHILQNTNSLKKLDVYDKLNAKSLKELLRNLLKIKSDKDFIYDLRTVELARLMYEITSEFISSSPQLSHDKFLKEDLEKISQSFTTLSKSVLQQHAHEKLSKDKEEQIKKSLRLNSSNIQEVIYKKKMLTNAQNKIKELSEERKKIIDKINHDKSEIERLKFTDNNLSNQSALYQKLIELNEIGISKCNKKILIEEKKFLQNKDLVELNEKRKDLKKQLSKYDDLQDYFSPINPLEESNQE